jgi:uncharacterized coiled-coil DUF342 family protein
MTDGHNNEHGADAHAKGHAETADLKERISSLNDRKEQAFQKKQELSTKIGEKIRLVNDHKKARNELTKQVRDLKEERDKLNTQISASIAELKELQPEKKEEPVPAPQISFGPRGEKIHPSELKRKIKAIEQKIETVPMSFDAEQKLMKQLKQMKKQVGNIETSAGKHSELVTKSKEIDKLKKSANALHAKVTQLAKQSQDYHEKIINLSKEIEDLKGQEDKLQEDFLGAKKEYLEATGSMRESQAEQQAARNVMRDQREREKQQRAAEDKKTLQQRAKEAEDKMMKGEKLTTEDLLALQSIKD